MIEASVFTSLQDVAGQWASAMGRASLQGGVALGLAWAVCRCFPRLPARWRCWLWRLAFLKLALCLFSPGTLDLPLLPSSMSFLSGGVTAPANEVAVDNESVQTRRPGRDPAAGRPPGHDPAYEWNVPEPPTVEVASASPAWSAGRVAVLILTGVWAVGVLALAGLMLARVAAARRWRRECVLIKDPDILALGERLARRFKLVQPPLLCMAEFCRTPVVFGAVRTAIVLPESLVQTIGLAELRLVLAHEMAHIRRGDLLGNWFVSLVSGVFFFHPLVWLAFREIRLAQETACDELGLDLSGGSVVAYGNLIVELAARCRRVASPMVAVGVVESFQDSMKRRIRAMKNFGTESSSMVVLAWFLTAVALVGLLPWRVVAQAPMGDELKAAEAKEREEEAALRGDAANAKAKSGEYTVTVDGVRHIRPGSGIDMEFTGFPMISQKNFQKKWSNESPDGNARTEAAVGGMGGGFAGSFKMPNMVLDVKVERPGASKGKTLVCEVNGKVDAVDDLGNTFDSVARPASMRSRFPGVKYREGSGRTAIHLYRPKDSEDAHYIKSLDGELLVVEAKVSQIAFKGAELTRKTTKRDGDVTVELTDFQKTPQGLDLVVTPSPAPLNDPNDMFQRMRRLQTSMGRTKVTIEDTQGNLHQPTQSGSTSGGSGGGSFGGPGSPNVVTHVGGMTSGSAGGMTGGGSGGMGGGSGGNGGVRKSGQSFSRTWGTPNNGGQFSRQSQTMESSSGIECHFDPLPEGVAVKAIHCTVTDHVGQPRAVPFHLTNVRLPERE